MPLSFLFACGDDSGSAAADNAHGESDLDAVVENVDELSEKFEGCDGKYAYVKFEKSSYICSDGERRLDEKILNKILWEPSSPVMMVVLAVKMISAVAAASPPAAVKSLRLAYKETLLVTTIPAVAAAATPPAV